MAAWGPWIEECNILLDGDGTFRHLPYSGSYREQPAFDMEIHNAIRHKWNELRNEQTRQRMNG